MIVSIGQQDLVSRDLKRCAIRERSGCFMKRKFISRLLTAVLALTMLMGSALTVFATSNGGSGTQSGTQSIAPAPAPSDSDGNTVAGPVIPDTMKSVSAGGSVTVAGAKVANTVRGIYDVVTLDGVAVITPLADLIASLGLTGSQTPFVFGFDTDASKSHLAMDCVNAVTTSLNADLISTINVLLCAKDGSKTIELSNGSAGMVVGLPKNADLSRTYFVVRVQPQGVVTILNDLDASPATVTFEIQAGWGTYAVIAV